MPICTFLTIAVLMTHNVQLIYLHVYSCLKKYCYLSVVVRKTSTVVERFIEFSYTPYNSNNIA